MNMWSGWSVVVAVAVLAVPAPAQEVAARGTAYDGSGLVVDYPVFQTVVPPKNYVDAIEAGTRSEDGRPGDSYWQQQVDYKIEAVLDPANALLSGTAAITVSNNSPSDLKQVVLVLYQNVFSEGVPRNRSVTLTGGMDIGRIAVAGVPIEAVSSRDLQRRFRGTEEGGGYVIRGTIAPVVLPEPVPTGASVEIEIEWEFTVSGGGGFRNGHLDHEVFNIAQWYPQVTVYDDVAGQDVSPYLGNGEFYDEYGDFEVSVTVPTGWVVVGTGTLQNPDEVLLTGAAERLASASALDTVISIVSPRDLAAGEATAAGSGGQLTWRFHAENVRDFAFATSNKYVWDATGAATDDEGSRALIQNVYDPAVEHWSEATLYAKHAIEFYSDMILPYPYPQATTAYGPPQVNGMEYPMITFINRSAPGEPMFGVVTHELSHFWMPMIVGTREKAYAWMDEGLTNYNSSRAWEAFYDNDNSRKRDAGIYVQAARSGAAVPLMQHTDHVESGFGRSVAAYMKPATLMFALRRMMGGDRFDEAYKEYAAAWAFKHPLPWDFFSMMEEASGGDLDWFWQAWFYGAGTTDVAISDVHQDEGGLTITLTNTGDVVMPVELKLTFDDGSSTTVVWPVNVWAQSREVSRTLAVSGEVLKIEVDPENYFLDIGRSNNTWEQ
jgi:hypothetical protein